MKKQKHAQISPAEGWDGHCFGFKIEVRAQNDRRREEREAREKESSQKKDKKESA